MAAATLTLREHLSQLPNARVVPPSQRDEDLGQFVAAESEPASDAELVEERAFEPIRVTASSDTGFTHFLDGAQRSWLVAYVGMAPVYLAHTSAGLLERRERELLPPESDFYSGGLELVSSSDAELPPMPDLGVLPVGTSSTATELSMRQQMQNAISARREDRETEIGRKFERGFLLIDGGIGKVIEKTSPAVQLVGVVKSHQRQYFASKERIRVILEIKAGERTPVFLRERNQMQGKEAYSFYLRLFDAAGHPPLFGLIRVEMPAEPAMAKRVDEISGWLLAERAPLSLPDARYDRMIYPIRLVEQHLKARQPSDAAIRAIQGI